MFAQLLRFEFYYQSRQLSWWFALIMLTTLGYLMSGRVVISGNVDILSPQNITYALIFISQISIFSTTLITANSALRDTIYDFSSLVDSKPVDRKILFLSRFISLFFMSLVIVFAAIAAVLLPILMTNYDPEVYGVFKISYVLWPIAVIILPNMLFTTSILYFSASKFKTTIMTFVSGIAIYIFYLLSAALLDSPMFTASNPIARGEINYASLFDPFAISAFLEQTQFWTSDEKNSSLVSLSGDFLYNRMIWVIVALVLVSNLLFKRSSKLTGIAKNKKLNKASNPISSETITQSKYKSIEPKLNLLLALKSDVLLELRMTMRSGAFVLLFVLVALLVGAQIVNGMENNFFVGVQHAYTSLLLPHMSKPFSIVGLFIVIFFAGEMVWRARDSGFDSVISATPAPKWLYFVSKIVVMTAIILLMQAVVILIGIGYQLSTGFYADDIYLFLSLVPIYGLPLLLMATLCLSIQYISINKYVGYVVTTGVLLLFTTDIATYLGLTHNLLIFASIGPHYYSDFSGFDFFISNIFWFSIYWILVTSNIAIICYGLSKRSLGESLMTSLKRLPLLLSKGGFRVLQLCFLVTVLCGGFVFYNTNIINHYVSADDVIEKQLNYETQLRDYKNGPQLKITDVNAKVDFFPYQHKVVVKGEYKLKNTSEENIDKFLITLPSHEQFFEFTLNHDYRAQIDHKLSVIHVTLDSPISPDAHIDLVFTTSLAKKGFKNHDRDISLLSNGSYFHASTVMPYIGYDAGRELQDNDTRLTHGLSERQRLAELKPAIKYNVHGHENDASWINYEAIVSTHSDQIAIAPGVLINQWTDDNRAFFHYKVNDSITNFLGFASGKYETKSLHTGKTNIKAFYHPSHDKNIDLMLNTAAESLKYFEHAYGPYPFPDINLVELPNRAFARAYPGTIYISEHIGFKEKLTNGNSHDDFSYLIAHEIAHQWWGHQLASAKVEGEVLLIETLADYSALMVMKKLYGDTYVNNVVADSTRQYLRGRSADVLGETPLYKMLGQRYLRYHKGPVVLNAIRHLITEDKLNQVLRTLLEQKANAKDSYATSLDLLRLVKAMSSEYHHELIDEWLTEIVTYDLSISNAEISNLANDKYQVTAHVSGQIFKHDPLEQRSFNHNVTVAAYSEVFGEFYLLQEKTIKVNNSNTSVTFNLDEVPAKIVIDPNYLFIDRNRVNNTTQFN